MNRRSFVRWCFVAGLAVSLGIPVARAGDVIIDVSSLPRDNPSDQGHKLDTDHWYANAFTTDAYSGQGKLDAIFLALSADDFSKAGQLVVQVRADDNNTVSNSVLFNYSLKAVNVIEDGVKTAQYSVSDGPGLLAPNKKYWLVVGGDATLDGLGGNTVKWFKKNPGADVSGTNATIIRQVSFSNNAGGTGTGTWRADDEGNQMMRFKLNTAQVPEPSTYVLGSLISGTLILLNRRKKRE